MRVNVNGGHSRYARGASGYLDEYDEDRKIIARLVPELRRRGCAVSDGSSEERTVNGDLVYQVKIANASGAEIAASIHLNAGGGRGVECYYFGGDAYGYRVAADMSKRVAKALGLPNRGAKDGSNLYFIRNTNMTAVLLEVCFVDTKSDADAYNATSWDALIGAIADAIIAAPAKPEAPQWAGVEVSGANRVETANAIADRKGRTGKYMQTTGENYADALSGMWVAGKLNANILYGGSGYYITDGSGGIDMRTDNRFGTNRYSLEFWEKVKGLDIGDTCFVIPGDHYADGMSCAWVSYNRGIPIILYEDHPNFYSLIGKFEHVIAIGDAVPKFSGETERIGGADRAAVAVAVAERYGETWGQPVIVSAANHPDGIAAAQWIGNDVLLYGDWDATIDALKRHKGEIKTLYWVGDASAIPYERRRELSKAAGLI